MRQPGNDEPEGDDQGDQVHSQLGDQHGDGNGHWMTATEQVPLEVHRGVEPDQRRPVYGDQHAERGHDHDEDGRDEGGHPAVPSVHRCAVPSAAAITSRPMGAATEPPGGRVALMTTVLYDRRRRPGDRPGRTRDTRCARRRVLGVRPVLGGAGLEGDRDAGQGPVPRGELFGADHEVPDGRGHRRRDGLI